MGAFACLGFSAKGLTKIEAGAIELIHRLPRFDVSRALALSHANGFAHSRVALALTSSATAGIVA